jgi:transposase InsO family protein
MVTDQQVRRLRQKIMERNTQETAAAASGMSARTARIWQKGALPSEKKERRTWRTRPGPFAAVWAGEIEPVLREDPGGIIQATTILEWLDKRHPDQFKQSQVRTLQRHLRDWRAIYGPDKEVYFPQEHPPGREAQLDFTHGEELKGTISSIPFRHLFFELVMSFSGWRFVDLAMGETLESLVKGLQGAVWKLGGAPQVVRSDNLSAATHELKYSRGRSLNERYGAVISHYGIRPSMTNPASPHENGVAEQAHYRLKSAIVQALILRGRRNFPTAEAYLAFVRDEVVERRNRRAQSKLD